MVTPSGWGKKTQAKRQVSGSVGTQTKVQAGVVEKPAHHINCCSFSEFFQKFHIWSRSILYLKFQ